MIVNNQHVSFLSSYFYHESDIFFSSKIHTIMLPAAMRKKAILSTSATNTSTTSAANVAEVQPMEVNLDNDEDAHHVQFLSPEMDFAPATSRGRSMSMVHLQSLSALDSMHTTMDMHSWSSPSLIVSLNWENIATHFLSAFAEKFEVSKKVSLYVFAFT